MNQTFQVQGMTCAHCERAVAEAVRQVDPQAEVKIDRSTGTVNVQSNVGRAALAHAIADEGYTVAA